jgi:hypothetical protein
MSDSHRLGVLPLFPKQCYYRREPEHRTRENKTVDIQGIAAIVTYSCNLSCSHCFFDGRNSKARLSVEILEQALAAESATLSWLHFTGGEPLLDPEQLIDLLQTARKVYHGDIGIASNGYWGRDSVRAGELVRRLKDLGVNGISLSVDSFHQPEVPLEAVGAAAEAVAAAGLNRHSWLVACVRADDEGNGLNQKTLAMARQLSEISGLPVAETAVRSIGRGAGKGSAQRRGSDVETATRIPQGLCRDLACCLGENGPFDPQMVWIDPYANVMICYGLTIGSLRRRTLTEILEDYDPLSHPLLRSLAEQGPKGLYALAEQLGVSPGSGPFFGECDLCFHSRRALRAQFPEILGPPECYPPAE